MICILALLAKGMSIGSERASGILRESAGRDLQLCQSHGIHNARHPAIVFITDHQK